MTLDIHSSFEITRRNVCMIFKYKSLNIKITIITILCLLFQDHYICALHFLKYAMFISSNQTRNPWSVLSVTLPPENKLLQLLCFIVFSPYSAASSTFHPPTQLSFCSFIEPGASVHIHAQPMDTHRNVVKAGGRGQGLGEGGQMGNRGHLE